MKSYLSKTLLAVLITSTVVAGAEEAPNPETATATFSMYCYWTGEATVGRVEGVLASRIGHWGGSEIVQVDYDPKVTSLGELADELKKQRSFYSVVADRPGSADSLGLEPREVKVMSGEPHFIESKYSLRRLHPELLELDLTEWQAIQLNSWSFFGGRMPGVLTTEQSARVEQAASLRR